MPGHATPADIDRIAASLDAIEQIAIAEEFWDLLGKNLSILRAAGVTVPFADAMIATLAIENDLELWTRDAHFTLIKNVLIGFRLFQAEPSS